MQIDHLFVFTETPDTAAEQLLAFGLSEGSSRVHAGQGTANRKFYFENFFLELLWVHDEAELRKPALQATQLWQRARHREHGASPFGLCLVNTPDTDAVFATATPYQPAYFPAGMTIDVLAHEQNRSLPWTFRLPFKGEKAASTEPTAHHTGMRLLTEAVFGLTQYDESDALLRQLANQPQLRFEAAPQHWLSLTFDHHQQGKTQHLSNLSLTIHY